MTFNTRFKDNIIKKENNNLNKTNSFPNLDKKIAISFQLKNSKYLNQIFNLNEKNIEKKNYTENKNKKGKSIYKIKFIKNNLNDKKIISYRIEKAILKNKESNNIIKENTFALNGLSKEFSFTSHCNKLEHPFKEINNHKKFIYKRKNYILEDKNNKKEIYYKNEQKIYKNKGKRSNLFSIKNICTKDNRIIINIKYIPYIFHSKNNYFDSSLKIDNNFNYNYIAKSKKNKNIIKRKNDDKLTLIREEDEKSKCLNSTKSLEEELNSILKTSINNRMAKDKIIHNSNIGKIVLLLNNIYDANYFYDKKYFIFKLKIIFLFSCIKS